MKSNGVFLLVITGAIVQGCASPIWVKQGASQQDWQRDYNDCLVKANQAGYPGGDLADNINRNKFMEMCVQGQGWSKHSQKEYSEVVTNQHAQLDEKRAAYKAKMEEFAQETTLICSKPEYDWIAKKTPCDAKDISMEQLADDQKIQAKQKKAFLNFRKEAEAVAKDKSDYIRANISSDADRQWADFLDSLDSVRIGYNLDLYNGKISWGEYNKFRKDLFAKIIAEQRRVFQVKK